MLSCKVAMLGWLQRYPSRGDCVQDGVGVWVLGGPWKFYAAVCPPKPLSGTHPHAHTFTPCRVPETVYRSEAGEGERVLVWSKGLSPVKPSSALLRGTFLKSTLLSFPHIPFFTSPVTLLILKTETGCSFPPPIQLRDIKFLEPMCLFCEGSVVLL